MEKVPSIISQNPYRVLGVYTTTHVKDRVAMVNRIKAYVRVGKTIDFTIDFNSILPSVNRSEIAIEKALSQLNLQKTQLKYALFWFSNTDSFDDISLGNLNKGDVVKAKAIMSKRASFSSLINRGVVDISEGNYSHGVSCIYSVINNSELRNSFIKAICGDNFIITSEELSKIFNEALSEFISPQALLDIYKKIGGASSVVDELDGRAAFQYEQLINAEVAKAKHVDMEDSEASYNAGIYLRNATSTRLNSLLQLLGKDNLRYQRTADKVALQVLQCSINYYNSSTEPKSQAIHKALDLAGYASTIAVGALAKDRIKRNTDILNNMKAEAEVEDDLNFIALELNNFQSKVKSIVNARNLLDNCYPHLQKLKTHLGASNETYLQISTAVAGNVRGMLVAFFNAKQKDHGTSRSDLISYTDKTLEVLEEILKLLDINKDEKKRCQKDVNTLNSIKETKVSHLPFNGLFQMRASCKLQINNVLTFCKHKLKRCVTGQQQLLMVTKHVG